MAKQTSASYKEGALRKATLWKWLYAHWSQPVTRPVPGYTILLLVPGDLPVFLKIALVDLGVSLPTLHHCFKALP